MGSSERDSELRSGPKTESRESAEQLSTLLPALFFMVVLLINLEDGGDIFLRNVG
jgi:hypothetical protein